jgi:hypothetical protein
MTYCFYGDRIAVLLLYVFMLVYLYIVYYIVYSFGRDSIAKAIKRHIADVGCPAHKPPRCTHDDAEIL